MTTPNTTPTKSPSTLAKIEVEAQVIAAKFALEYGAFTRFLVAHPKGTFFAGAAVFFIVGALVGHIA